MVSPLGLANHMNNSTDVMGKMKANGGIAQHIQSPAVQLQQLQQQYRSAQSGVGGAELQVGVMKMSPVNGSAQAQEVPAPRTQVAEQPESSRAQGPTAESTRMEGAKSKSPRTQVPKRTRS
jgi:hypothetical protein